jgi:hypothetical protein
MSETIKKKRIFRYHGIILNSWPFMLAILVLLSVRLAIRNPGLVELYFSKGIYPFIAKGFSSASNLVTFSLWDFFWILITLLLLCGLILVAFKKIKSGWYVLRVAQLLAILYSFFYLSWGFNYFRPGIETRLGWERPKLNEQTFRLIMNSIINNTNNSYIPISPSEYSIIDNLIEKSYYKNSTKLGINYPGGTRRPKKMVFSSYFAKSGISGYFGPFFNEVHWNSYLLPMEYPFLLAHEKAHQFGISNEAEANLAAFIICTTSDDQRLQYSGYFSMLHYFLKDAERMNDYIKKIDKRVIEDIQFRHQYYYSLQNKTLKKVQTAANDAYLKSNNIKMGVKNYNQVVSLVISWYHNSDTN